MSLVDQVSNDGKESAFLGYPDETERHHRYCLLELIFDPEYTPVTKNHNSGYWKIAISVEDLDIARQNLISNQVQVSTAFQVPDVAYLCHLEDPDGYCIELIQHEFQQNQKPKDPNPDFHLGTPVHFSLITYRITNPETSLSFYQNVLGMRLLSRQKLQERGFTLYFFGYSDESLPVYDIDAVGNREWLWQRPYTLIELQHVWRSDAEMPATYDTSRDSGFECVSIKTRSNSQLWTSFVTEGGLVQTNAIDNHCNSRAIVVNDPDGYRIRLIEDR